MNLTQVIKGQAYRLGFSLVGVTTPDPLPHADVLETWLQQSRHGEMAYLGTPRSRLYRARPDLLFPECRSVLVLGICYQAPPALAEGDLENPSLRGKVAAYAWGNDYHEVLPQRLKNLVAFIESRVGHPVPNRWYTDTGPLLEKELAQRAGLGWIGKNTCLISPGRGSYLLLAEILLGIELEASRPFSEDRCGKCTRCVTTCPTGCILPDRTLDSRRCISYLTIEQKDQIPRELRSLMGAWVFGCDLCQQVCPWNRFATPEADPVFGQFMSPHLLDELVLSTNEFNRKYRHSPIKRTKRKGYLRNVAVALGNSHSREAIPVLVWALEHDHEPLVRAHVAWALGRIGGEQARHALERAAVTENDGLVKLELQISMANPLTVS